MSTTISVEIPDDVYALLAKLAATREVSVDSLVSAAVLETLAVTVPTPGQADDKPPTVEQAWDYIARTHSKVLHRLAQ